MISNGRRVLSFDNHDNNYFPMVSLLYRSCGYGVAHVLLVRSGGLVTTVNEIDDWPETVVITKTRNRSLGIRTF